MFLEKDIVYALVMVFSNINDSFSSFGHAGEYEIIFHDHMAFIRNGLMVNLQGRKHLTLPLVRFCL